MCHASTKKVHKFGVIDCNNNFIFNEEFTCIGEAVCQARGNDNYIGVVLQVLRVDGSLFREELLIKKSRDKEFVSKCKKRNVKRSIMDF